MIKHIGPRWNRSQSQLESERNLQFVDYRSVKLKKLSSGEEARPKVGLFPVYNVPYYAPLYQSIREDYSFTKERNTKWLKWLDCFYGRL